MRVCFRMRATGEITDFHSFAALFSLSVPRAAFILEVLLDCFPWSPQNLPSVQSAQNTKPNLLEA